MVVSKVLCWSVLVAVLTAAVTQASIELVEEANFTVRGLSGQIEQIKFNDIDGDGFPEVLASDGQDIVLYSVTGDSVIFASSLDSYYLAWPVNHRIEFADVNRDSAPDIIVGYYYRRSHPQCPFLCRVTCYDGASNFTSQHSVSLVTGNESITGVPKKWLSLLKAVDVDEDGYDELVAASQQLIACPVESMEHEFMAGETYLFQSFPDSLAWRKDWLLTDVRTGVPSDSLGSALMGTVYWRSWNGGHGQDYSYVHQYARMISESGDLSSAGFLNHCESCDNSSDLMYIDKSCKVSIECVGDMDPRSPGDEIITSARWQQYCLRVSYSNYQLGEALVLYNIVSQDSVELLRVIDSASYSGHDYPSGFVGIDWYTDYAYYPDYPGTYFAFSTTLLQFDASDGSVIQSTENVPEGSRQWDQPYGDDRVRLVVFSGNDVAFYYLDVSTGIADGRDSPALPKLFELGQPYPNPFNAQVTIPVTMLRAGHLSVDVFNLLGRKVVTVYDGPASVGQREYHWNAEEYASGVYLFKATTGGETATIKATLLK